jgi:hypothetical protein
MALGVVVASIVLPALWGIVAAAAPVIAVGAALVGAIALARTAWENDWGGILTAVMGAWAAIQPAWVELRALLDQFTAAVLPPLQLAWTTLGQVWRTEIQPALGELWKSLKDLFAELGLGTGDTDLWSVALGTLKVILAGVVITVRDLTPVIHLLGAALKLGIDMVRDFVDGLTSMKRGAEAIIAPLQSVADKIGDMISAAAQMPSWLIPGSPTPFEMGLRGIGSAMQDLSRQGSGIGGQALGAGGGGGGITIGAITIQAGSYSEGQEAGRGFVDELRSRGLM